MPVAKRRGPAALTPRQERVFNLIRDHIREHHGQPPTLREIADLMGFGSVNGVMCHVRALEKKGAILRCKHMARGIQVLTDEPIRAARFGNTIKLDCGVQVYDLDEDGAARLGEALIRLSGKPRIPA